MIELDGSNAKFPVTVKEEYYSVCMEPGEKYLFHFNPEKATNSLKHAEIIANNIVEWLTERGIDKSLKAVGGDSTNVNIGWEGRIIKHIEIKLGKILFWLICQLHTNELPLKHLITYLDGETKSNNKWSGVIGPMLVSLTTSEIMEFLSKPMQVPNWPCHGQSVECCVKQVTEASSRVHTHEKRDGFVRTQEASRKLMSKNNSKQDLENLTEIFL